ncbi:hypothetical protein BSKO_08085 [Bryopsis sp. KO-2023]|nr:hypothetical protein BSKO_08085 [Bryopsis sp. KO-2023]
MEFNVAPACQGFSARYPLLRAPARLPSPCSNSHVGRLVPAFRAAAPGRKHRLVSFASKSDKARTKEVTDDSFDDEEEAFREFQGNPMVFVGFSVLFYGAMLGGSIYVAQLAGAPISKELLPPYDLIPGLVCTIPLCLLLLAIVDFGDDVEEIREIKSLLQKTIVPLVKEMPFWGPLVLALGAGIGEEAAYRALIQSGAVARIDTFTSTTVATIGGIAVASGLFGLGHALNRFYFWWATFAGVYFGIEYILYGLPSTALTHALYDWFAFIYVAYVWGQGTVTGTKKETKKV